MNFSSARKRLTEPDNPDKKQDGSSTPAPYIDPFSKSHTPLAAASSKTPAGSDQLLRARSSCSGPLSVEEALRLKNQQTSNGEASKPVFLTKAQRAQLALERKQQEADAMREQRAAAVHAFRNQADREDGEAAETCSDDNRRRDRHNRDNGRTREQQQHRGRSRSPSRRDRDRDRDRYYDRDSDRYYDRYRPGSRRRTSRSRSPPRRDTRDTLHRDKRGGGHEQISEFKFIGKASTDGTGDRVLTDKEREMIKQRYLSGDHASRSGRKQTSRKVVFDWDTSEDTSRDISDLYERRHELQLFGRGHNQQPPDPRGPGSPELKADQDRLARMHERRQRRAAKALWDERHWTEKPLKEMRDRDWRIFKEDFSISCKGGSIPHPLRSWHESRIPIPILRAIEDIGYKEPTPIQRQAIPVGLQNRDLIGIAETGSGKTASFLIPMLAFIMTRPPLSEKNMADGPYALILAPTRELAQQIEGETHKFARRLGYTCVSIVGGHDIEQQAFALRNGAEIIIATPGRLRDCIDRRVLVLNQCTYVVMDEADRMIDMGFEEDVNFILDALPVSNIKPEEGEEDADGDDSGFKYRQTTMFSATMPPVVERMARKYLRTPATVTIGTAGKAVDTVEQRVEFVSGEEKRKHRLLELLSRHHHDPPIIVFVNQKKNVDLLGRALTRSNYSVVTLHGGKSQEQRELSLAKLKNHEADILVATDVAGRGIDVKDVSLVVNFDMAKDIESYTHRIGRTGRAGKRGLAVTFLGADDRDVLYDLKKMVVASPLSKCPHELASHEAAQAPPALMRAARK
ncbi:P-loop containing nucleoside triphosphate hydrolase protein [Linderina pennispora]|uniref:RNA helicase n=1 Tax=Linderina pennispora TaxID=61395 RepID=A0A1Y1VXE2_9FUNG|nr:P-loop containing nucleoside triphosphate hydrolase protein [Linderina pennispora]ORX65949.1 P-loop containing nucleoside triphosphate hydrolase protein [Linderina pennispora]